MCDNSELLKRTITHDLFGPRGLTEPAEIEAPAKYELLECLGRGGFGVVYKARDRSLDRLVALKFLLDARPKDIERFRREARLAARLDNPAIVQVYELGECGGQAYIAMQFIDGGDLAKSSLPMNDTVRAVLGAARALQQAHAAGIVHRDFKPANVLLDRDGRAYLTDFGIARDLNSAQGTLSHDGLVMGTPALMSPEQARGDLQAVDARSDIYSVGASLYLLLTGRYPFERDNLVDLLHAVVHDEPPLPRSLNASIPRALEAVILKCMQKNPAGRYQSISQVIVDLEAVVEGRSVAVEPAEWFRKLVGAPPAPQADSNAFQDVRFETAREIADWDANLYRVSRGIHRFFPRLDGVIRRLGETLRVHPDLVWARFYRGVALFRRGRLAAAVDEMERSIDRLANQADAQFEMGRLYLALFLREQHEARKHLSRVGTEQQINDARDRLRQARVCFEEVQRLRSDLLPWQVRFADAVARFADLDYDGCVAACDQILTDDADLEEVWKLRGDALRFAGAEPFESYDEAVRVRRSDHEAHQKKAEAYLERARFADARDALRVALEINPESVGALVQAGRTCLLEARASQDDAEDVAGADRIIGEGLDHAASALELDACCYDALITQAELLIERTRLRAATEPIERALQTLNDAAKLDGCQNRVKFLTARALFERACITRTRGGEPHADLRRVLDFEGDHGAQTPDNRVWTDLIAAARSELEKAT